MKRIRSVIPSDITNEPPEKLLYDDEVLHLWVDPLAEPLADFWDLSPPHLGFAFLGWGSAWRHYVATWEIADERLYLVDIDAQLNSGEKLTIQHLFPGAEQKVLADWYSGKLRASRCETIDREGFIYYEDETSFTIENGVVKKVEVRKETVGRKLSGPFRGLA